MSTLRVRRWRFVRSSLTEEDLPPLPLNNFRSDTSTEENDEDVMSPVGDMGGLAELQARVQMLRNAQRSHKDAWEALVKATSDRVDALRTSRRSYQPLTRMLVHRAAQSPRRETRS